MFRSKAPVRPPVWPKLAASSVAVPPAPHAGLVLVGLAKGANRGTRAKVIKPDGQAVEPYVCRFRTSLADSAKRGYAPHCLEFRCDGWRLIVPEIGVIKIEVKRE